MTTRRARIIPLPGESASSLVFRAASTFSAFPPGVVRALLGDSSFLASAVHRSNLVKSISEFAGVPESAINNTMAYRCDETTNCIKLGDFFLRPGQIKLTPRKVAPACFREDIRGGGTAYHRLIWCVCALDVDPDTGFPLIETCAACCRALAWINLSEQEQCGFCNHSLIVDACTTATRNVVSDFYAGLFQSSADRRSEFRATLPASVSDWPEMDIITLTECLSCLRSASAGQIGESRTISAILAGPAAITSLLSDILETYRVLGGRFANAIGVASLTAAITRSSAPRVTAFLLPLLGAA